MLGHLRTSLWERRATLGLSQADVAERAGLTQSYYSRVELGKIEPRIGTLQDIARALHLEMMLVPAEMVPTIASIVSAGPPGDEQRLFAPGGD